VADDLETILRRVASGELDPADAERLVAEATEAERRRAAGTSPPPPPPSPPPRTEPPPYSARAVRVQVTERGRNVVDLRVPMSWASLASVVPGLSGPQAQRIREALRNGVVGRIVEIQGDDGDGVVISTE
jgi:hypothetical protein